MSCIYAANIRVLITIIKSKLTSSNSYDDSPKVVFSRRTVINEHCLTLNSFVCHSQISNFGHKQNPTVSNTMSCNNDIPINIVPPHFPYSYVRTELLNCLHVISRNNYLAKNLNVIKRLLNRVIKEILKGQPCVDSI